MICVSIDCVRLLCCAGFPGEWGSGRLSGLCGGPEQKTWRFREVLGCPGGENQGDYFILFVVLCLHWTISLVLVCVCWIVSIVMLCVCVGLYHLSCLIHWRNKWKSGERERERKVVDLWNDCLGAVIVWVRDRLADGQWLVARFLMIW